ncbi:hypothetical protein C8R44DRAFT_752934 [Mycena epipterygia]|nr:hypothetical protein C8R44DRAFT_752934 [Mycena epipterygia]
MRPRPKSSTRAKTTAPRAQRPQNATRIPLKELIAQESSTAARAEEGRSRACLKDADRMWRRRSIGIAHIRHEECTEAERGARKTEIRSAVDPVHVKSSAGSHPSRVAESRNTHYESRSGIETIRSESRLDGAISGWGESVDRQTYPGEPPAEKAQPPRVAASAAMVGLALACAHNAEDAQEASWVGANGTKGCGGGLGSAILMRGRWSITSDKPKICKSGMREVAWNALELSISTQNEESSPTEATTSRTRASSDYV